MESSDSTSHPLGPAEAYGGDAPAGRVGRFDSGLADVVVLGGLLALTATFGRGFSTLGFPGPSIYVTEVGLALTGGLALLRLGPAGFVEAIRSRIPLIPLAIFWVAAAVAAVQGIRGYGVGAMIEDIGLGEYSLLLPVVAVVATSPARTELLTKVLVWGLMGGTVVYAISDLSVRILGAEGTFFDVPEITFGLYMSMLVGYVAAQLGGARRPPRYVVAFGALALVLVFLTNARGVWFGLIACLATVALLQPPGRRLRFGGLAAAAAVCALGLALGIQVLGGASQIAAEVNGAIRGVETADPGSGSSSSSGSSGSSGASRPDALPVGAQTEEADNARWRIAIWTEMVDRSVDQPVFGVGYGEPIAFTWEGRKFDFRDGDPAAVIDVDGPHNEYLHILYRMGYVGLGALVALIVTALLWTRRTLRADELDPALRSLIVGLAGMWVASATVAFFADALKSPFLGLLFWSSLGLLFAALAVARSAEDESAGRA